MMLVKLTAKRIIGLILFLTIATILALHPSLSRTGSAQKVSKEERKKQSRPLAVFGVVDSGDPNEKAIRQARNSRYDKYHHVPFDQTPAGTEERLTHSDWSVYVPALPAAKSDAVILGKIIDSKGYLSNNKAAAYSEFTVKVEKVLKDAKHASINLEEPLIASRYGADVRLPSGKIIRTGVADQRMPQIGQRYIFFLKYNGQGGDYDILTGYKIKKHKVYPLDEEVDHFAIFKGYNDDEFFKLVQEALAKSAEKEGVN